MSYERVGAFRYEQLTVSLLAVVLVSIAMAGVPFNAKTDDVSIQTVQFVDLSATAANIQILGAGAADHLSGSGATNSFATFPRSHAIATGDINDDGIDDLIVGAPDVDFTPAGGLTHSAAKYWISTRSTRFDSGLYFVRLKAIGWIA